jgi:hypothetical protein
MTGLELVPHNELVRRHEQLRAAVDLTVKDPVAAFRNYGCSRLDLERELVPVMAELFRRHLEDEEEKRDRQERSS